VHDASPEARALAGLAADLFDFVLFALLGFAFVNAYAPRQDLPWKPLDLDEPLGLATTWKLDRTLGTPGACLAFLEQEEVAFTRAAGQDDGGFCVVRDAVLMGPQTARLSPARPMMACELAAAFALWTRQVMQPAAEAFFGQPVAEVDHYGVYACRRIYGQTGGAPSRHAQAEAIDIAGVRLSDGTRVTVLDDWDDPGPKGRFLHRIRDDGCRLFRVALSPDYNAEHRNHLHFDMSPYRLCR